MKKSIFTYLFLFFTLPVFSQNAALKQQIVEKAQSIESFQSSFVQTKTLKVLNNALVSKGKMYYLKSGKLRWEYTGPEKQVFIIDGKTDKNRIQAKAAALIMDMVSGGALNDENSFETSVIEKGSFYVAEMLPKRKEIKQLFTKITLFFDKSTLMISKTVLTAKNSDVTEVEFTDTETGVNIPSETFKR